MSGNRQIWRFAGVGGGGEIRGWTGGLEMEVEMEGMMAARRCRDGGGTREEAAAAWGRRRRGDDGEVFVAGAGSGGDRHGSSGGGGTEACGGGGGSDGGWTPSPAFLEQPLERESTPFFLQME